MSFMVFTFMLLSGMLRAGQQVDTQAIPRLASTERAFAAATAEIGVRDGFLTFFADDSVALVAGDRGATARLVPAKEDLRKRPLARLPLPNQLIWGPYTGHVSNDGTFGWLTGGAASMNVVTRDLVYTGAYFSVWKLQPDGTWRVWLDEGIQLPELWRDASPFRIAPEPDTAPAGWTQSGTMADAERAIATGGEPWRLALGADVRVHRDGKMPFVGRAAALAWEKAAWQSVSFSVIKVEMAGSGDLGVAIGGYDAMPAEHGTWVRVWKRDVTGRWRIVFETSKPAK
jgi:hypothetical protein